MNLQGKKRVDTSRHTVLKIAIAVCALLVCACAYGVMAARSRQNRQTDLPQAGGVSPSPAALPAAAEPERLGAEGKVYLQVHYTKCGHTVETDVTDKEYIGMTKQDIEDEFSNAKLQSFSKDKAVLVVETPSICTLHFIVKYEEGKLNIYQPQGEDAQPKLYKSIEMETIADPALEEGVVFDSLEQVESYLENLES